jgi:alpha-L-fucosidase
VYLSPWDRNAPSYADEQAYSDFYVRQLTELCTRYGALTEIWFDGAGSDGYTYDWERITDVIAAHQPEAMVFNMGRPTIRWVGNENGLASDPVEYAVTQTQLSAYTAETLDVREELYLPPECDVSLRRGWFWHPQDEAKTADHLMAIYYASIGMGANLLLNVPPNPRGVFDPADLVRLREWRSELDRRFAEPIVARVEQVGDSWVARFPEPVEIDHLRIREGLHAGQHVARHAVHIGDQQIASGLTIGQGRLHAFPVQTTDTIRIVTEGEGATLTEVLGYRTGYESIPQPPAGYVAPTTMPLDE